MQAHFPSLALGEVMQNPQYQAPSIATRDLIAPNFLAAMRPIGRVGDGAPVHPDEQHPSFDELKHRNRRVPTPSKSSEHPADKHPDLDRQVDDYA